MHYIAALLFGLALHLVVKLEPIFWAAWLVPAAGLAWFLRHNPPHRRLLIFAAMLLSQLTNLQYFLVVMPVQFALLSWVLISLLWQAIFNATVRFTSRATHLASALIYPALWLAADFLLARFHPDGNVLSLAYTQATNLPILQLASLGGVYLINFILALPVVMVACWHIRPVLWPQLLSLALIAASYAYGFYRLESAPAPTTFLPVGLAAIDNFISDTTPYQQIRAAYESHVARLAASGARVILLPEKIAIVNENNTWRDWGSRLASTHKVTLILSVAIRTPAGIRNIAWVFSPSGDLALTYDKQYLAPPERGPYVAGHTNGFIQLDNTLAGVAICKDMHFARLALNYAHSNPAILFVPAWDFQLDAWYAARVTLTRGVESGYSIVRSSRDGMLTITDPYGRVLAASASAPLPGASFVAQVPVAPRLRTPYSALDVH